MNRTTTEVAVGVNGWDFAGGAREQPRKDSAMINMTARIAMLTMPVMQTTHVLRVGRPQMRPKRKFLGSTRAPLVPPKL